MNEKFLKVTAGTLSLAILTSACENLTPEENAGLFGGLATVAVGVPLALAGVDPRIVVPVAAGAGLLAAGVSFVVAKHQASERQRKIAEQRARIYMANLAASQRASQTASSGSSSGSRRTTQTASSKPAPRYIAINTEKEGPSTKAKGPSVMIYDTQSSSIVGNNVYDLKSQPQAGANQKFDTYSAQYVGNGTSVVQ